ncbi:MAG: GntR family transcriptional regulator [Cognatishimia sp.]
MKQAKSDALLNNTLTLDATAHLTLTDHIRARLRLAIISGQFAFGEKLNERALAEQLGASTTPLKEALKQLQSEGLVKVIPRRGVLVRFNRAFAEEMILARRYLESALAEMAAKRADKASVEKLGCIIDEMEMATKNNDVSALLNCNEQFHTEIHTAARSVHIANLVEQQQFYDSNARQIIHENSGEQLLAYNEHREIYLAIAAHDPETAARRMAEHILRSGHLYLDEIFDKKGKLT